MFKAHHFVGELIGTFILVFFGCGAVAVTVLFSSHVGLFQIAIIWGLAVTLAIYATRHLSCAHFNPAVSLAMVVSKRMGVKMLPVYWIGQFAGAFLAAAALFCLFASSISNFEAAHSIIRGTPDSVKTAMMFGEFYPKISMLGAFGAETMGTFLLVFFIFSMTEGCNVGRPHDALAPLFIGMAVMIIICVIAPLTQAALNPARDLAPRAFTYLAGWRHAAFPDRNFGLLVYGLGPLSGGCIAAFLFVKIIQPLMDDKSLQAGCACNQDKIS